MQRALTTVGGTVDALMLHCRHMVPPSSPCPINIAELVIVLNLQQR